ncbi:hypothetical protein [Ktedonobacter racemifer]|nr:hypothetical protein [Ktedonobacter racemifer]
MTSVTLVPISALPAGSGTSAGQRKRHQHKGQAPAFMRGDR